MNFFIKNKTPKSERSKAIAKADRYFSKYIRLKHSRNGACQCVICGSWHAINNIDCGHFLPRARERYRYSEDNCRPQCKRCNRFRGEESKDRFEQYLRSVLGEKVDEMKQLARLPYSLEMFEINNLAEFYKQKVKEL